MEEDKLLDDTLDNLSINDKFTVSVNGMRKCKNCGEKCYATQTLNHKCDNTNPDTLEDNRVLVMEKQYLLAKLVTKCKSCGKELESLDDILKHICVNSSLGVMLDYLLKTFQYTVEKSVEKSKETINQEGLERHYNNEVCDYLDFDNKNIVDIMGPVVTKHCINLFFKLNNHKIKYPSEEDFNLTVYPYFTFLLPNDNKNKTESIISDDSLEYINYCINKILIDFTNIENKHSFLKEKFSIDLNLKVEFLMRYFLSFKYKIPNVINFLDLNRYIKLYEYLCAFKYALVTIITFQVSNKIPYITMTHLYNYIFGIEVDDIKFYEKYSMKDLIKSLNLQKSPLTLFNSIITKNGCISKDDVAMLKINEIDS